MTMRRFQTDPSANLLLSILPAGEFEKVAATLQQIDLKAGDILWEVGDKNKFIYFPTTAVLSLDFESDRGETVSIALIGRSGMAGSDIALGNIRMPDRGVTLIAGEAFRMPRGDAQTELQECGDFQNMFTTYTSALLKKISQNAVCNRLHQIDQQICRLLLEISDESSKQRISLTHQRLSELLGIRRESVSVTIAKLKKRKAIDAKRGGITIRDRSELSSAACDCYEQSKENFATTIDFYASH